MQRRWQVLTLVSVATFVASLDLFIVNIAFPEIRADLGGASLGALSWVLNAYAIVFAALLVPAGRLADRVGRKRGFLAGLALFSLGSALCGISPSVATLVAARVLQAAGAALLVPTSLALLLPEFPLEQRATATAIWGATGAVAAATGPSLGGVLVDATGWRLVFFVNLAFGLAALVPARRLLRETREPDPGPLPDALGVGLLIAGVALVSLGIVKGEDWGWGGPEVLGSLAAGVALVALCVLRSGRHPAPVVELSLFRVRSFAVASGGVALFALGFYALLLGNVLFLTQVWGWSILTAGFALTPGPLTAAITAPLGGAISDRFGQRVVALPGGLLFAAGCLLFAANTGTDPAYVTEFLPATLLTGAGVGLSFAAWGSAAVAELPPARYATGSAVAACARQIGAVLGIAVLIAVIGTPAPAEALDTFHRAWTLMAIPATAAGLLGLALGRVHARNPEAAPAPAPA
jgi:EmrB/QacA subfamily drug resistance transporter